MITPEWLSDELGYLQIHKELQESITRDIVRRIMKTDFTVTDTAAWQAEKLQQSGMVFDEIISEVSKLTKKSESEIKKAFEDAQTEVFNYDDSEIESSGYSAREFKRISPQMKRIIRAALSKTVTEAKNLTKTTAVTSQSAYIQACDLAHMQIASGAFTYQEAIKNAVKSAAIQGVNVIYPSGHKTSLDAAVRRAVLTGVNQTAGKLQEMRADEMDIDIMELSAHYGARPDHAEWQGQLVSRSGKPGYLSLDDIGYGRVDGFMGANCRHDWYLFFEGYSKRKYTAVQLEEYKNAKVTYNGEEIPVWQALDRQRAMERRVRGIKQQLVAFDEAGKNVFTDEEKLQWKSEFDKLSVKLKTHEAALSDFCSQTGLTRDKFREQVFSTATENGLKNWGKSVSQKAVWANKRDVDNSVKSGIIKAGSEAMYRKSRNDKIEPMPKKQLHRIEKSFKTKGGIFQYDDKTDEYLKSKNAEAVTYNSKTILLRKNPGRASVFEELIHATQYRNGENDGSYKSRLKCEIAAQEKLLKYSTAYKLTKKEIEQTQKALKAYQTELEAYIKGGGDIYVKDN